MRGRILRSTLLVVPLVMLLAVLGTGPAFASPLTAATATAFGVEVDLLGSNLIPPTPNMSAGPAPGSGSNNLVTVPLETVAFAGVAGAKAQTTRDSILGSELPAANLTVTQGGPAMPDRYNAQAYARTTGATVIAAEVPELVEALLGSSDILSADVIHSEALASCVNGVTTLVGGSQLVGAELLGIDLTPLLDGTVNQVIPLADTVLGLLGGTLVANEQIRTPNSLTVNALHLTLPDLLEVTIAHSSVTGVTCAPVDQPECSDGIDNDGDGLIDAADPGCWTDPTDPSTYDPNDDSEANILPRTGGNNALLGATLLAGGALLLAAQRRRAKAGLI